MEFEEAYKAIVEASVEKDAKEVPTILSCFDFDGLDCLEIGCGPLARLAFGIVEVASHVTCLEANSKFAKEAKDLVREEGMSYKIKVREHNWKENADLSHPPAQGEYELPFEDNSFDVVYSAWLPHSLTSREDFLREIARISRKYVLLIMPGTHGDEPDLVSIVRFGEKERREEYRRKISNALVSYGFFVNYKSDILKLDYKNFQEIKEVYYCLAFKNEALLDKKQDVDVFLSDKVHDFKNGFYCLWGEK